MRRTTEDSFWSVQARVMHALIVREIYTRFGRENIGFAWIVVEPIIFCLAVIVLWTMVVSQGKHLEVPIVEFLLTGYMPLIMYRHGVTRLMRCMQANAELLYHRGVTIFSMYIARLFIEIVGTMAAFLITTTLFVIWGFARPPHNPPMILAGFALYALFVIAISILIGALSERSELVEKFWGPLSYMTLPLSGTFYMLYWLPPAAREVLAFMPMASGVEIIRGGYLGPGIPVFYQWEASVVICLVILAVGLLLLRHARRYVEMS
jgi:capsular polysaccharide transport system permease protein